MAEDVMDNRVPVSCGGKNPLLINPHDLGDTQTRPTLFLVRHAESTGNQGARLQGSRIGGTLSDRGHKQSEATAKYLLDTFNELRCGKLQLVSSPSSRALQTAQQIADRLHCDTHLEGGLAELDFGEWSGKLVAQLENDPVYLRWKADPWSHAPPGGESLREVQKRVCRTVSELIIRAAGLGECLIVVTHFFPLLALFDVLTPGRQVRCDNASVSRVEAKDAGWLVTHANEVGHLREFAPTPVRYV
jgi:broad specificity phosphatase PhoE